jgi:hypothetical protein
MTDTITKPKIKDEVKAERPRLHKVILVNDEFTPREFVVAVLRAEFRMREAAAPGATKPMDRRGAAARVPGGPDRGGFSQHWDSNSSKWGACRVTAPGAPPIGSLRVVFQPKQRVLLSNLAGIRQPWMES